MANRYWRGGTGNWSATNTTNWSTTSGGAGGASVPTAADSVFFDGNSNTSGAFTVTVTSVANCLDLNISNTVLGTALDGVMNLAGTLNINVAGSLYTPPSPSTNFSRISYTGIITFTSTTTGRTITGSGGGGGQPYTFNGVGGGWTLQNDFFVGPIILTAGAISLGTYTLATNSFTSSNSNTRAINFGTGVIQITGTATAWNTATVTGFSYTGTPTVNMTNGSATATTVTTGPMSAAQALNFNFTAGTYALTLTTGNVYNNLNFTGFAGTVAFAATTHTMYGDLNLGTGITTSATAGTSTFTWNSTSGTRTITSNGRTSNFGISLNGVGQTLQLADAFIQGSTQRFSLVNGTFDMATYSTSVGQFTILTGTHALTNGTVNAASVTHTSGDLSIGTGYNVTCTGTYGFNAGSITINNGVNLSVSVFSSASAGTRSVAFGTGSITTIGTGTVWNVTGTTGLSYTGTPTVNINNNSATAATVTNSGTATSAFSFNINAGTYALTLTTGNVYNNLNFTGFAGTVAFAATTHTMYGNLNLGTTATMSATAGTGTFIWNSTAGTRTITSNGRTANFGITLNGVGQTLQLADAFTQGSNQSFFYTAGTFDMATYSTSVGVFTISAGTHAITNGTVNCAFITHTSGDLSVGTGYLVVSSGGYTFTAGTITINNGVTLSIGSFSSSNIAVRSIAFGTGNITITDTGTLWNTASNNNFSYTGTPTVNVSTNNSEPKTINTGPMSAAQALNFNITTGTYALTISSSSVFNDLSFVGFGGSVPLAAAAVTVYGNIAYDAATTSSVTTGSITLAGTSAETITTNGAVIGHNIIVNGVLGTYTLQDAFTGTGTLTLTNGTLALGTYSLTVGAFASSNSNARTLNMGTNTTITIVGNNTTVWNTGTLTNFTLSPLTAPTIILSYSGATGTRTINSGSTLAGTNAFTFRVSAGTDTVTFTSANSLYNLNFTGFSGTWSNVALSMYGSLILSSTMTVGGGTGVLSHVFTGGSRTITSNGKTLDFPITVSLGTTTPILIFNDTFTQGSTRAFTLTNGTLNVNSQIANVGVLTILTGDSIISNGTLNCVSVTHTSGTVTVGTGTITSAGSYTFTAGTITINNSATITTDTFTSSGAAVRVIAFGTGQIDLTGNTSTVWNLLGPSNFSYSGISKVNLTYSGSAGSRTIAGGTAGESLAINFNVVAGSDTIIFGGQLKNVNLTGFAGTFYTSGATTIFGNITIPSGLVGTSSAGTLTLGGTTGTQILDVNGSIIKFPITIANAATRLDSAFNHQEGLILTSGALDLNGKTLTTPIITTATGIKSIIFNGGNIVLTNTSGSVFNNAAPTNFTTSAGTGVGTISVVNNTIDTKTFAGGGSIFAAKLNQGGLGTLSITGSNTFDDITNTVQPTSILFTAGTTTTLNNLSLKGTNGNLVTIGSITAANHTLTASPTSNVSLSFCSISRSVASGGALWRSYTNNYNVDGGNNTGWIFNSPITSFTGFF